MNINWNSVWHWIIRHSITFVFAIGAIYLIWFYFGDLLKDILFAIGVAVFSEFIALILSNLAVYLYTNFSFVKGIIYGENELLDLRERYEYIKVLGSIFLGVHILVAIVMSMLFWGKIGS